MGSLMVDQGEGGRGKIRMLHSKRVRVRWQGASRCERFLGVEWSLHHDIAGDVAIAKTALEASSMPLRGVRGVPRGRLGNAPIRLGKYGRHRDGSWPTGDDLLVCECFEFPDVRR